MSDYTNSNDSNRESQNSALADLAAELAVDVEALEERLEMISLDAMTCCVINGGACHASAA
ncbi:MAG: hypothetical protein ACJ746_18195 [Bryobacteraceae bacterium]